MGFISISASVVNITSPVAIFNACASALVLPLSFVWVCSSVISKYFNEECFIEIEGKRLEFLGGKFSNTLLKVLELATKEYTNGGNHLIIHDDFDDNFQKIKEGFLPNVSVVDLLPAVIAVSKLGKKEIAYLSEAISKQSSFRKMLEIETNNELLA